jgi:hypothetical protein
MLGMLYLASIHKMKSLTSFDLNCEHDIQIGNVRLAQSPARRSGISMLILALVDHELG